MIMKAKEIMDNPATATSIALGASEVLQMYAIKYANSPAKNADV